MELSSACPIPALRPYIRCFEQREARLEQGEVIYPIAARPEQFLEFYPQERYLVHSHHSGTREAAPPSVVVGPSTYRRIDLVLHGHFEVFTIHFQPAGFFQLFGVPLQHLTDRAYEARSVIGAGVSELESRLADAPDFRHRIEVATSFLTQCLVTAEVGDPVARIAMIPFATCLIVTRIVRRQVKRGRIPVLDCGMFCALMPRNILLRAILLGFACAAAISDYVVGRTSLGANSVSIQHFLLFKLAFAGAEGALITPLIAFLAISRQDSLPDLW
jgi:hypothetical protein